MVQATDVIVARLILDQSIHETFEKTMELNREPRAVSVAVSRNEKEV
jgi:hypothetical protein